MVELRVNEKNQCYLDAFLQTDTENLALIDSTLVHPTEQWLHAAVVYRDGVLSTYINGDQRTERTGQIYGQPYQSRWQSGDWRQDESCFLVQRSGQSPESHPIGTQP
jgi:hypothetical protein